MLKSYLYWWAADQCFESTKEQLKSANGVQLIVKSVYRRNFISAISATDDGFSTLINAKRQFMETLKDFRLDSLLLLTISVTFHQLQSFLSV